MRRLFESDFGFYYAVGGGLIVIYVVAVTTAVLATPTAVDRRTLIPLTVGFLLFMVVYFAALSIQRLIASEEV